MKITITIPDEYKKEWYDNRFEQTLQRLKADAHSLAGKYEKETADMLTEAFKNGHGYESVYCKNCSFWDISTSLLCLEDKKIAHYCEVKKVFTSPLTYCEKGKYKYD